MKKSAGTVLLVIAAALGWWWWQRRQASATIAPDGSVTIPPNLDTSTLPNLQQVGSNVSQDITGDVLDRVLNFVEKLQAGCWLQQPPKDGRYSYRNSITGQIVYVAVERVAMDAPRPLCGQ